MSAEELPKHYDFARVEAETSEAWLAAEAFRATPDDRDGRYVVMMPLPNVTGALHMGHALDNVVQDLWTRWHRMRGHNALWQPGTDHAGISTQAVVEKQLKEEEGKTRHDIGREALIERIYAWKDKFQARIIAQQQAMGASCDWTRQRFTMDPVCARAVREWFFRFFRDRLIYQGDRLVNWDCHLHTAVADDELYTEDVAGHFWHLRYPVIDPQAGEPAHLVVATTRPETMMGDTAVAVHPDPRGALEKMVAEARDKAAAAGEKGREAAEDELARLEARVRDVLPGLEAVRDMAAAGREVLLPLQERPIPIVLDEHADPGKGSGCVKITPAHDQDDYQVWGRHKDAVELINILNRDGTLNENAGAYAGLGRYEAREKVVADLDAAGLLAEVEDRVVPIPHSDRSKTPIEPLLSKEWFVRMGDLEGGLVMGRGTPNEFTAPGLAQAAMDAIDPAWSSPTGRRLTFYPDHQKYGGMYHRWLAEKRDWCISRQLWWGHQIPIWKGAVPAEKVADFVAALRPHHGEDLWVWFATAEAEDEIGREVAEIVDGLLGIEEAAAYGGDAPLMARLCLRREESAQTHAALLAEFGLTQDENVLDTWFSSALWPMSTLGWPDPASAPTAPGETPLGAAGDAPDALSYYYPGSCLMTGRDIITLWVARMVISGLYLLGDVPFHQSFIHATIQDGKGTKMSKSLGNGIDPVDIIERYGADSLRYVLCDLQTGSQDVRLPVQADSPFTGKPIELGDAKHGRSLFTYLCPETGKEFDVLGVIEGLEKAKVYSSRFELGRAFCTKLWNAARFAFMTLGDHEFKPLAPDDYAPEDRWVLSRLDATLAEVDAHLEVYNPSKALAAARDFFWNDFCDWYLELIKPRMKDEAQAPVARSVLSYLLDQVLRVFHPFVPFITEELWKRLATQCPVRGLGSPLPAAELVAVAAWPTRVEGARDEDLERDFTRMQEVVRGIRDLRAKYTVSPKIALDGCVQAKGESLAALRRLWDSVVSQARLGSVELGEAPARPKPAARAVIGDVEVFLADVLDPVKEQGRLEGQRKKLEKSLAGLRGRLGNPKFADKAPPEVVAAAREQLADAEAQLAAVEQGLADLSE